LKLLHNHCPSPAAAIAIAVLSAGEILCLLEPSFAVARPIVILWHWQAISPPPSEDDLQHLQIKARRELAINAQPENRNQRDLR
jgi:hypothetical protein